MKKRLKKGSIFLEILLGLVVISFITYQALVYKSAKDEQNAIEDTIHKVSTLVSYGIYDIFKGYSTSGGGDCSSGHDVKNISAKRVQLCTNIPFELVDNTVGDNSDASKSFFIFLDRYAIGDYGCKIFVDDYDDFTSRLLIDCSGLNPNLHKMVEEKFAKQLSRELELMYKASYFTATSFTDLLSGTLDDGILIVEFQK